MLLALNLRSEREPLFRLGLFSNRLMVYWAAATSLFVLLAVTVPGLQTMLKTVPLSAAEWALALGAAGLGTFWLEAVKLITWRQGSKKNRPGQSDTSPKPSGSR